MADILKPLRKNDRMRDKMEQTTQTANADTLRRLEEARKKTERLRALRMARKTRQ